MVAVPSDSGQVTLLDGGKRIAYDIWMEGMCLDCITSVTEFEGEMSETPFSDYMDAEQLNEGWN